MTPRRFFDGARLRGDLFNPGRDRLFVSYRQRIGQPGAFDTPRPVQSFIARGYTHLALQTRDNDWYVNDETAALEEALASLASRHGERVSMGFSMGGFACLRFARALRLHRALVISPQYTIWKKQVRWDKRYRAEANGWDHALGDLETRGWDMPGAILADPFRRLDLAHAEMIRAVFPRLALVRLGCGGHPATRVLNEGGRFGWLRDALADDSVDPIAIGRAHRACRRKSPGYWRHLAALAGRHGRASLEQAARARTERLSDGS